MTKKLSELSRPGKPIRKKQDDIVFTEKMREELRALKNTEPDMTDPDAPEIIWKNPIVGKFYRPRKKQVTIRIDLHVLEWFKQTADQYQTLINDACKEYMMRHQKLKSRMKQTK